MKTIYVDDDEIMVKRFCMECNKIDKIELVGTFNDPEKAIQYARKNEVNCAFLDISMPHMSGIELSRHLKNIYPDLVVIYVSAYDKYMAESFRSRDADYYILKPYSSEDIVSAMSRALLLSNRQKKRIYVETFGNFNVYIDGKFLDFSSKIAKEIFALLVNKNGTALTNKEAFFYIWEDVPYSHENMTRVRKGVQKLRKTLADANISDILISSRSEHRLDTSKFDCDYYDFLKHDISAYKKYQGQYMLEYSWGEETNATLAELYQKYRWEK